MFNKSEITVHFFCKEYCELMLAILTSFKVQWRDEKGGVARFYTDKAEIFVWQESDYTVRILVGRIGQEEVIEEYSMTRRGLTTSLERLEFWYGNNGTASSKW